MLDKFINDVNENKWWFLLIALFPILVYFSEFSSFPLTMDELRHNASLGVDISGIQQGRWGMYFLTYLYSSNPVFPFVGIYISSIIVAFSLRYVIKEFFPAAENIDLFLCCGIAISYPSLYYFYSFSTVSFAIGGICFSVFLSIVYTFKESLVYRIYAIVLFVISLSIYQSSITVYVSLFLIVCFFKIINQQFKWKCLLSGTIIVFISLTLYALSIPFFNYLFNVKTSGYVEGFYQITFSYDFFEKLVVSFFDKFIQIYSFSKSLFVVNNFPLTILLIISPFIIFFKRKNISLIFISFLITLAPLMLSVISTNGLPTRSFIALPLSISFLIFVSIALSDNQKVKRLIRIIAILAIFFNIVSVNKLTFIDSRSWENDKMLASMLMDRIYALEGISEVKRVHSGVIPTHLIGYKERKITSFFAPRESIGKGFFAWGSNEILNITNLFGSLGFGDFVWAPMDDVKKNLNEIRSMESWPDRGSIKIINNIVYVKISDYTEAQQRFVCNPKFFVDFPFPKSCSVLYNPLSVPFSVPDSFTETKVVYNLEGNSSDIINGSLQKNNGTLTIIPNSSDLQIILPKINSLNKTLMLHLSGEYTKEDTLELYLYSDKNNGYYYNDVIKIKIKSGMNDYSIVLPSLLFKNKLRVDLTTHRDHLKNVNLVVSEYQ